MGGNKERCAEASADAVALYKKKRRKRVNGMRILPTRRVAMHACQAAEGTTQKQSGVGGGVAVVFEGHETLVVRN